MLRALQLGDMLCAVPALRALRAGFPAAEIVLIGLPWARQLRARFPRYLDDFISFPGHPALPERAADSDAVPSFLHAVRERRFDLAIQMHGDGRITNALAGGFGAARCAGFYPAGSARPDARYFVAYRDRGPEVRRLLRLVTALGGVARGEALEFPVRAADRHALAMVVEGRYLKRGDYVCLHPGARAGARCWPVAHFAAVAIALIERGMVVVLTGTQGERAQAEQIVAATRGRVVDLVGRTGLGALAALVADARLLISNDTGVSHLAAALAVPSVIVFTGSDRRRWAPLDASRHVALTWPSPGQVIAAALAHLQRERTHAA